MTADEERRRLREAYHSQRSRAFERGVIWAMSFEGWLRVWTESGHLHERGRGLGKYCMSRPHDHGPYVVTYVRIVPFEVNAREFYANPFHRERHKAMMRRLWEDPKYRAKVQRGRKKAAKRKKAWSAREKADQV